MVLKLAHDIVVNQFSSIIMRSCVFVVYGVSRQTVVCWSGCQSQENLDSVWTQYVLKLLAFDPR